MPQIGVPELVIILVIVMFVFGAGKLPEVGRALGRTIRDFRQNVSDVEEPAKPVEAVKAEESRAG